MASPRSQGEMVREADRGVSRAGDTLWHSIPRASALGYFRSPLRGFPAPRLSFVPEPALSDCEGSLFFRLFDVWTFGRFVSSPTTVLRTAADDETDESEQGKGRNGEHADRRQ